MRKLEFRMSVVVALSLLLATGAFAAQETGRPQGPRVAFQEQTVTPEPTDTTVTPVPPDTTVTPEPVEAHPVVRAIANYFGVPAAEVRSLFEQGTGFGVIARAYFMSEVLGKTPQELIQMKETGDTPWGQLVKDVRAKLGKRPGSLGTIMSGHGTPQPGETPEPSGTPEVEQTREAYETPDVVVQAQKHLKQQAVEQARVLEQEHKDNKEGQGNGGPAGGDKGNNGGNSGGDKGGGGGKGKGH